MSPRVNLCRIHALRLNLKLYVHRIRALHNTLKFCLSTKRQHTSKHITRLLVNKNVRRCEYKNRTFLRSQYLVAIKYLSGCKKKRNCHVQLSEMSQKAYTRQSTNIYAIDICKYTTRDARIAYDATVIARTTCIGSWLGTILLHGRARLCLIVYIYLAIGFDVGC